MSFEPTKTWEERFFSRKAASVAQETGFKESDANPEELAMGVAVELEHGGDVEKAKATALDHLAEMPDYYTKLKKMEGGVKTATMKKDEAVSFGPPTKVKQEVMVSREDDPHMGQTGIVQTIDLVTHDVEVLFPGVNGLVHYKIEDLVTWDAPMEEDVLPIHHPGWKGGDRTGRHWETLHVHACFRKEASGTPYETKPSVGDSTFAASPDELVPSSDGQRQEAPNESDSNSRVSEMEKAIDLEIKKVKDKKKRRAGTCPKCMCHAAAIQGNHTEALAWASEIPGEETSEAKLQRVLEKCPKARRAMLKQAEILTWKTNPYGTESGTCAACAALDGEAIDTDNPFVPRVPMHPHCSCSEEE